MRGMPKYFRGQPPAPFAGLASGPRVEVPPGGTLVARRRRGAGGLGDYGNDDPNVGNPRVYDESTVFMAQQGDEIPKQVEDPYYNPIQYNPQNFASNNTSAQGGSVQVLQTNMRRSILIIQNQDSAANLWVNYGQQAGVGAGLLLGPTIGIIIDEHVTNQTVFVFFDSVTNAMGVVIEGTPQF